MTTALEGGEGSELRPGRSLPPGKTRYPFYRRLGGPHDRFGQVRKISPPPKFDPRTIQPVACRYTYYATRPTSFHVTAVFHYGRPSDAILKLLDSVHPVSKIILTLITLEILPHLQGCLLIWKFPTKTFYALLIFKKACVCHDDFILSLFLNLTVRTARFRVKKFYFLPSILVLYAELTNDYFPCTELTDRYLQGYS